MKPGLVLVSVGSAVCAGLLALGYFIGQCSVEDRSGPAGGAVSSGREGGTGDGGPRRTTAGSAHTRPAAVLPEADEAPLPEEPPTGETCPPAVACPECGVCAPHSECPACPPTEAVCRPYRAEAASMADAVRRLEMEKKQLEDRLSDRGPKGKYPADSAQERRVMAAKENSLLMEFPSWGEDLVMQDSWAQKLELSPEERQGIETLYQQFRGKLYEELRSMYADMVGDPDAGANETINALIHNIQGLSPRELCQERILAILAVVAAGGPLPEPAPDAPACERVVLMIFQSVDAMDAQSVAMFGEKGKKALWSGTSSFETSTGSSDKPPKAQ